MRTQIAVIDYGSQYSQLIVRRLRGLGYFSKLFLPGDWDAIGRPAAVILSGGPARVNEPGAPDVDFEKLRALDCPVLGVCYGMQLLNRKFGGSVAHCGDREYGPVTMTVTQPDALLPNLPAESTIWMSHSDSVSDLPSSCEILATNPRGTPVAVRVIGEITPQRLDVARAADAIFIGELRRSGWYDKVWQAGAVLLPVKTVGVKGDERTYEEAVSLRAVTSVDAMTADWVPLPPEVLARVSKDILNQVPGINRVLYDISTKPPAGIEWE